jgi:hypothetical protein
MCKTTRVRGVRFCNADGSRANGVCLLACPPGERIINSLLHTIGTASNRRDNPI